MEPSRAPGPEGPLHQLQSQPCLHTHPWPSSHLQALPQPPGLPGSSQNRRAGTVCHRLGDTLFLWSFHWNVDHKLAHPLHISRMMAPECVSCRGDPLLKILPLAPRLSGQSPPRPLIFLQGAFYLTYLPRACSVKSSKGYTMLSGYGPWHVLFLLIGVLFSSSLTENPPLISQDWGFFLRKLS